MVVTGLYRYPVKSCAGEAVSAAQVTLRGLEGDRRWMIVDEQGVFLSQRSYPRLACLGVTSTADGLRLSAPGMGTHTARQPASTASTVAVQVWKDTVQAQPADPAASAWCAAYLGHQCQLVYMPGASLRPVDPDYGKPGDIVSFADGYPLLLTHEASLADLNSRMTAAVPMNRFRPNLVVQGGGAFAEDGWTRLQVGAAVFRVVKPCARCATITVDQATGVPGKEPLRTLSTFRRRDGKVYFGENLIPEHPGEVKVGDPVSVLA